MMRFYTKILIGLLFSFSAFAQANLMPLLGAAGPPPGPTIANGGTCHALLAGPTSGGTYTTAVNCTGAKLFHVGVVFAHSHTCTMVDSSGNTYMTGQDYTSGTALDIVEYYVFNPTATGITAMQWKVTGTNCSAVVAAIGVTGSFAGSEDVFNGANIAATFSSLATGSATPSVANEACFVDFGWGPTNQTGANPTYSDGFTALDTAAPSGSVASYGLGDAYLFAPVSGTALNSTGTFGSGTATNGAIGLSCFK
jgi:hypothetical protein